MKYKTIEDIIDKEVRIIDIGKNDNNYIISFSIPKHLREISTNDIRKTWDIAGQSLLECKKEFIKYANSEWGNDE